MSEDQPKTPEELRQDAIKRTVETSPKYAMAKAQFLPEMIKKYALRYHPPYSDAGWDVFEYARAGYPNVTQGLARLMEGDKSSANEDLAVFFSTFAELTDPTIDRKAGKECKYLHWICKNLLKTQIYAEDLYKIRDRLNHFEHISTQLKQDGKPNQINQVESLEHLEDIMRPYEVEKMRKAAERVERKMSQQDKDRLAKESSILFEGPEGKIVIPHTMWASQYWGNQTKWCISAAKKDDNYFDGYNKNFPVIIYLPKVSEQDLKDFPQYTSFKSAAVGGSVYDEHDQNKAIMPRCLRDLVNAAADCQEYLYKHGSRDFILQTRSKVRSKDESAKIKKYRELKKKCFLFREKVKIPKSYWQDRDFFKVFYDDDFGRENFPKKFYADVELAREIFEDDYNARLSYFDEVVRKDKEINRIFIKGSCENFDNLHPDIQADKELQNLCKQMLLEKANNRHGSTNPCTIPRAFMDDEDFARDMVSIAPYVLNSYSALSFRGTFSEKIRSDIDIILIARAITHGESERPTDRLDVPDDIKKKLTDLKYQEATLRAAARGKGDKTELSQMAQKIIKNGHGLSDKLVPEYLLKDIEGYVLPAIHQAIENGGEKYLISHLRNIPALHGDSVAIISVERAVAKLEGMKKPPTVKPRRFFKW